MLGQIYNPKLNDPYVEKGSSNKYFAYTPDKHRSTTNQKVREKLSKNRQEESLRDTLKQGSFKNQKESKYSYTPNPEKRNLFNLIEESMF